MNVYVTVGTQLPVDRLVCAVDDWAAHSSARFIGQIGRTEFRPAHMEWHPFLESDVAERLIRQSDLVVAHAGTGTILTRLEAGRPMMIMPRRASLAEHRNDHQAATAQWISHFPCITVVEDVAALSSELESFRPKPAESGLGATASPLLLQRIREFILPSG